MYGVLSVEYNIAVLYATSCYNTVCQESLMCTGCCTISYYAQTAACSLVSAVGGCEGGDDTTFVPLETPLCFDGVLSLKCRVRILHL